MASTTVGGGPKAEVGSRQRLLVIGGNSFMGLELVQYLAANRTDVDVCILNRGHVYWNFSIKEKLPQFKLVVCDRSERKEFVALLKTLKFSEDDNDDTFKWDAVIDFCAYKSDDIQTIVDGLSGRLKHYIFISTDSVYMACARPTHGGLIKEDDDKRPEDPLEAFRLSREDKYGSKKLECETLLKTQYARNKFPYTTFRLSDVIGAFDQTDRFWRYQLWILTCSELSKNQINTSQFNVDMSPLGATRKLSFVWSCDVVTAAMAAIKAGRSGSSEIFGQSFNIAHAETPTLMEFIGMIGTSLKIESIAFHETTNEDAAEFFPSVDFGAIDISKALRVLTPYGWNPSPIQKAINMTCSFFNYAFFAFPDQIPRIKFIPKERRELAGDLLLKCYNNAYQKK